MLIKLTLLVDKNLIQQSKDLGLNISRITEKVLEETVNNLKNSPIRTYTYKKQNYSRNENSQNTAISSNNTQFVEPRAGFEPATYSLREQGKRRHQRNRK
jgi:post-segregation antitoxin (ccd killing protein)